MLICQRNKAKIKILMFCEPLCDSWYMSELKVVKFCNILCCECNYPDPSCEIKFCVCCHPVDQWSSLCRLNHEVVSMQCRVVLSCVDQSSCYCMLHHKIVVNGCGRWTRVQNSYSKVEAYETDDGQVWALSNSYRTGCWVVVLHHTDSCLMIMAMLDHLFRCCVHC